MTLEQIRSLVSDDFTAVDQLIIEQARITDVPLIDEIGRHITQNRGKRLRPLMLLLAGKLTGGVFHKQITMAAVIEFIHIATLLHDDVVDESAMRRGQQTANHIWGNQASVLVGDFLYSRAFQMMVQVGSMRVMDIMSETTNVIASGEVLQLVANNQQEALTESAYFKIIERKTAQLFSAATEIGGLLNDIAKEQAKQLQLFGFYIGRAFQITDDLLDYIGDAKKIGKSVGDDLRNGKVTLPLLYLQANGNDVEQAMIKDCCDNPSDENVQHMIEILTSSKAIPYSQSVAEQDITKAKHALSQLPQNDINEALCALCDFVIVRDF